MTEAKVHIGRTIPGAASSKRRSAAAMYAAVLLLLLLAGCTSTPQQEKYYYTLRYDSKSENHELIQSEPIDISVWVRDASISRSYTRKQIVVRHFGPRISYLDNHLWANALEDKIPELITKRLSSYRLFKTIRRDFPYTRPDYELVTNITSLEFLRGEGTPEASLQIRFDLRELQGDSLVTHEIERSIAVYDRSLDSFVQVVNEAILEYTNRFAAKVLTHFGRGEPGSFEAGLQLEQARMEETDNVGQLLLPGVFEGREQPTYTVIDEAGEEQLGRFGTPLNLKPGHYTVRYGSGTLKRQIRRTVTIREGYRMIIEPDYGGLRVEAVTPDGRSVETAYEIFDAETGNSYGTGYTSESMSEWEKQVRILPVGRYKVTINNRPFTANRDYAAVYVEKGKGNILTLSVAREEESELYRVIGGGVIKEPLFSAEDERWILSSSIAGNVAGIFNNQETFSDYSVSFNLNGFLQNRLRYDHDPLNVTLLNLVEVGAARSETGELEVTRDGIEFDSTAVVDLLFNLGLYLNVDVSTHFLERYHRESSPFDYRMLGPEGTEITSGSGVEEIMTAPPFVPTKLQEGTGINLTLAESPRLESSARFGLGLRQNLYGASFPEIDTSGDTVILQQRENELSTGLEAALQLSTRLFQDLTYDTRFEAYAPFTDFEDLSLEWAHDLQLSLLRYFTIDYRATLYNDTAPNGDAYIASDHGVYFRFSTIYRISF
jgi:uncharacterized lipoprotein YmbA